MGEQRVDMPLDPDFEIDDTEWYECARLPAESHVQIEDFPFSGDGEWVQSMRDHLMGNLAKAEGGNEEIFLPKCFPGPEALLFDDIKEYCEFMKYTLDDNRAPNPDCGVCGGNSPDHVQCIYAEVSITAVELDIDPTGRERKIFYETEVYCIPCRKFTRREYKGTGIHAPDAHVGPFTAVPNPDPDGDWTTRPSCLNRPLCMIDTWGEAPQVVHFPDRSKPKYPKSKCIMDLPDKDGEYTRVNQCRAPRYEYFPNPGDPDYVPYKERNPGNKNEWEPKKRYMDKITKDWLREQEDKWKEQKIKETYGPKEEYVEKNPRYDLEDESLCAFELLKTKPAHVVWPRDPLAERFGPLP